MSKGIFCSLYIFLIRVTFLHFLIAKQVPPPPPPPPTEIDGLGILGLTQVILNHINTKKMFICHIAIVPPPPPKQKARIEDVGDVGNNEIPKPGGNMLPLPPPIKKPSVLPVPEKLKTASHLPPRPAPPPPPQSKIGITSLGSERRLSTRVRRHKGPPPPPPPPLDE